MVKKGFRQKSQPSKKQLMNNIDTQLRNVQMACRVLQIGLQQLSTSFQNQTQDIDRLLGLAAHLQFKQEALAELAGVSLDALNAKADEIRLVEYNKKSDQEDAEKNYTVADTVAADSVVVITSECDVPGKAIFRSKFELDKVGVPELQQKLLGAKVGDKVEATLNGDKHTVEVLAVRTAPPADTKPSETEQPAAATH